MNLALDPMPWFVSDTAQPGQRLRLHQEWWIRRSRGVGLLVSSGLAKRSLCAAIRRFTKVESVILTGSAEFDRRGTALLCGADVGTEELQDSI